jgi:hypothetical protein
MSATSFRVTWPPSLRSAPRCSHCQTWEREISDVAASSMGLWMAAAPTPRSQDARYRMPTPTLALRPGSVTVPSGRRTSSRSSAPTATSSRVRSSWLGRSPRTRSNSASAVGTGRGGPPRSRLKPSPASRTLSAATAASARSFASGSFRLGMYAAMPPMAWAPRRWHVRISSSVYARMNGTVMVTWARSGNRKSGQRRNFLVALQLRQVEVRARAMRQQLPRVVEKGQPEVEEAPGH